MAQYGSHHHKNHWVQAFELSREQSWAQFTGNGPRTSMTVWQPHPFKNKWITENYHQMDEFQKHDAKWKMPNTKEYRLDDSSLYQVKTNSQLGTGHMEEWSNCLQEGYYRVSGRVATFSGGWGHRASGRGYTLYAWGPEFYPWHWHSLHPLSTTRCGPQSDQK